ncbi:30S ribosomal protein S15 [[Mycoplasma] testudinis]|uniref:30S ribosomal protein S15 n=1 Tax=[Mycoplasma] testudinis TaxID=33924 RepID=UPI0004838085|nr:30S ribosomal protein S15 [[Mycoplasma] testudinis]
MALTKTQKADLINQYKINDKDVGSVFVQVSILTNEIKQITEHLASNKKDFISKRGLYSKVSKRKRLLAYLQERDLEAYRDLIKRLNIRR